MKNRRLLFAGGMMFVLTEDAYKDGPWTQHMPRDILSELRLSGESFREMVVTFHKREPMGASVPLSCEYDNDLGQVSVFPYGESDPSSGIEPCVEGFEKVTGLKVKRGKDYRFTLYIKIKNQQHL